MAIFFYQDRYAIAARHYENHMQPQTNGYHVKEMPSSLSGNWLNG